jgi:integrase
MSAETTGLPYSIDESAPKAKHAPKPENRRGEFDGHSTAAIRLLMLTGARLPELLHAKWEYIDFDRGMVFLPDNKTGRKPIYLSAAAAAIRPCSRRSQSSGWLDPSEGRDQFREPHAGSRPGAGRLPPPRKTICCRRLRSDGVRVPRLLAEPILVSRPEQESDALRLGNGVKG